MSDSSCRQTPSAGDDPSLNCLSMDFNSDVVQRGQWPSSTSAAAMSAVAVQHPRLVGSEDQMPLTDLGSSLSSADQSPPMEAYHATQWPIQLQQPPLGRASYGGAAPYRNPMRPVSYSSDYPNPAMWNTYDVRLPQNYVLSNQPNERPNREGHRVPHTDPVHTHQKPAEETVEFPSLDTDFGHFEGDFTHHGETPTANTKRFATVLDEPLKLETALARRMSESSYSIASTSGTNDLNDISAFSEVPSYSSDYTPRSSLNLSTCALSPVPSPRFSQPESARTGSRGRASPSPRANYRSAPYSLDAGKFKRWSTGSYTSSPVRRPSSFVFPPEQLFPTVTDGQGYPLSVAPSPFASSNLARTPNMNGTAPRFHRNSMFVPSFFDLTNPLGVKLPSAPPIPSNALFRTLHSNVSSHTAHLDPYTSLSAPPNLFGPLAERPSSPPPEDMNPASPTLKPHEQDLRFNGDLYTPKYVRGHGNKREGWCGICKPGRWLVLKNSAFWYDKSFTHGVSAATGMPFEGPRETRRMEGNAEVWEGLCGCCGEWVALVSSKKKGTTWFRHAYKCHTHPKAKDAPKRRREPSQGNIQFDCSGHDHGSDHPSTKVARLGDELSQASPLPPSVSVTAPDPYADNTGLPLMAPQAKHVRSIGGMASMI